MMFPAVSILLITVTFFVPSFGYRDGAREESCYNHTVDHEGDVFFGNCVPSSCRYFLVIKKVVNEITLELGNVTDTYECGKIYGIEVANNLNAPEGFLVQARNGTSDSSEIIGTFLHPANVSQRTGNTQVNYRILQCRRSEAENSTSPFLNNSATQPDTVNMAGTLQLYWQAPECNNDPCTEEDYPNVTVWFTIVQQLLLVFNPSKSTLLYSYCSTSIRPPSPMPCLPCVIMAMPSTSMVTSVAPPVSTSELPPISVATSTGTPPSIPVQPTATPPPPPVLSQGAIIGIGAGGGTAAVIIVVVIIVIVAVVVTKKKSKPSRESMLCGTTGNEPELPTDSNGKDVHELSSPNPFALNGTNENGSKTSV